MLVKVNIRNNPRIHAFKSGLQFVFCFLIVIAGCTFPGGKQDTNRIKLSIQNTLRVDRENIPIVLTLNQLRKVSPDFSLRAYSVVTGKAPREAMVPAQADDINYDGERDQLVFLLDLKSEETKELSILYDPNVQATFTLDVNKQTRAGIFPELNASAAIESDLLAYVLKSNGAVNVYGKNRSELFSVDTMFQSELDSGQQISPGFRHHFDSNRIPLSQNPQALNIGVVKKEHRWVIRDFENQENYYVRKNDEQLNLYRSIGLSLNDLLDVENTSMVALTSEVGLIGCGGVALWHKSKEELLPLPKEDDYVRIIANGAMRSIVQRIIPNWNINGETYQLTITTYVYGRNSWLEQHIEIDRTLPTDYVFVVGIPKLSEKNEADEDQGALWSWGTDPIGAYPLGMALIYPKSQSGELIETDPSLMSIVLSPDIDGRMIYRTLTIWDGGINGVQSEAEFFQQLQIMTTGMEYQPIIKFIHSEEE